MAYTKIRKNANKKIAAFIENASFITLHAKTFNIDDSVSSLEPVTMTAQEAHKFVMENYQDLEVRLHDDGVVTIHAGTYYFCNKIQLHVKPAPIKVQEVQEEVKVQKPRMTLAAVQAYLAKGFVSPLSHSVKVEEKQEDEDKQITKIKVLWSESPFFNRALRTDKNFDINQEVDRRTYNVLCSQQVANMISNGYEGGYYKTKIEVTTASGQTATFRHDISPNWYERTLQVAWSEHVDYCRKRQEENKATLERIEAEKKAKKEAEEMALLEAVQFETGMICH